jgi:hypothetical protein
MRIKQFLRLGVSLGLLSCPILLWMAPSAQAQRTNQSDATNINVTGSEIAPFVPLSGGGTVPTFPSSSVQVAVNAAAASLNQLLAAGNLVVDLPANIIPSNDLEQQLVLDVLTGINDGTSLVALLETIPSAGGGTAVPAPGVPSSELIQELVNALVGLTANDVDAGRLERAVNAYNAAISGVTDASYLTNPPGSLLTIRAALSQLVTASRTSPDA